MTTALQGPISTGDPVFMLFIAATLILMLGYAWGARRSRTIVTSALRALDHALQPVDRIYRNIGGLLGYHAVFEMPAHSAVCRVEATVTVVPRHALLYFPISLLLGRRDSLAITFVIRDTAWGSAAAARREPRRPDQPPGAVDPTLMTLEQVLPKPLRLQMARNTPAIHQILVCLTPRPEDVEDNVQAVCRWVEESWPLPG